MIPVEVMQQIRRIQIRSNRMVNDLLAGQYESVFKGQGMEFKEVREYVPGDDVRSIDWNVTARTGQPHVKVLAEEREMTVMLLVDASRSQYFGSVARFKRELAAEICAVLAFSAIKNNDKVGLLVFTDQVELFVPPKKGRKHVLRVVREVLYFQPKGTGTDLAAALHFLNSVLRRRAVAFVVSDFRAEGFETALRMARRRHDVIAVAVSDPREETLPAVGLASVVDAESGREVVVNLNDARLRAGYEAAEQKRAAALAALLRRAKVDVMHIRTDRPYVEELYRFFRMRERRLA